MEVLPRHRLPSWQVQPISPAGPQARRVQRPLYFLPPTMGHGRTISGSARRCAGDPVKLA